MEEFMAIKKGVRRYKEPEVPTKQVETAPKVPAVQLRRQRCSIVQPEVAEILATSLS
jgi:hypothetical protein